MTSAVMGRYRLGPRIGAGGMGRVWLARDEVLRRDVAIKEVLLPEGLTESEATELRLRTLREARAAARLSHPSVIKIYDVIYAEDRPWIVMEYVASRSLAQIIKEDGPMSPESAARIGLSVLGALCAAHEAGVLHRDVKPGNVLLSDDGRVVLTDFGLATYDEVGTALTQSGVVHGSPQFIAPERALDGTSTPAADMWSLGATLYAAVEGRSPYSRASSYATLTALATAPPDPPQRAGSLKPVLSGLLRRNPRSRMKADEVKTRLQRIVSADGPKPRLIPRQRKQVETPGSESWLDSQPGLGSPSSELSDSGGSNSAPSGSASIPPSVLPPAEPYAGTANGTGANGAGMNGAGANGAGANGAGMNGAGMNGTGMNGTGVSGTGVSGVGTNGFPGAAPANTTASPNTTASAPHGAPNAPRNRRAFDPVPFPPARASDPAPGDTGVTPDPALIFHPPLAFEPATPGAATSPVAGTYAGTGAHMHGDDVDLADESETDPQLDAAWSMDAAAYRDAESSNTPILKYLNNEDSTYGHPRRRRSAWRWVAVSLVALLLVAGGVYGFRRATAGGVDTASQPTTSPKASVAPAPIGSGSAGPGSPNAEIAALQWPCPVTTTLPTTAVVASSGLINGQALEPGWIKYANADGMRLGVPSRWRMITNGPVACFYDPDTVRDFSVGVWHTDTTDPVAAATAEKTKLMAAGELPGYQEYGMKPALLRPGRATWEYTYKLGGDTMHTIAYVVLVTKASKTTAYIASFTSNDFDWPSDGAYYVYLDTTFSPTGP